MYSDKDLEDAADAGIIPRHAVVRIRNLFPPAPEQTKTSAGEPFVLVSGLEDVFLATASAVTLAGIGWLAQMFSGFIAGVCILSASWLLSLCFKSGRNLALTRVSLMLAFVGGCALAGYTTALLLLPKDTWSNLFMGTPPLPNTYQALGMGMALATLGAMAHWRIHQIPATVGVMFLSFVATASCVFAWETPDFGRNLSEMKLALGLVLLAVAVWKETSDRMKDVCGSEVAFWVHAAAALVVTHATFTLIGTDGIAALCASVAAYGVLCAVALLLDRRALCLFGLPYLLHAVEMSVHAMGWNSPMDRALGWMVAGGAVLALAMKWSRLRFVLVSKMPSWLVSWLPEVVVG